MVEVPGRSTRVRPTVNYNDKQSMEPGWLKTLHTTVSSTPPKKTKIAGSSKSTGTTDSSEKENSTKQVNHAKEIKGAKKQPAGKSKAKAASEQVLKSKQSPKKDKKSVAAARGRNAGVTVVPIVDRKGKANKANSKESGPSSTSFGTLPKAPSQPKQIPGLPGVVQKGNPTKSRNATNKRKIPVNEITPRDKIKPIPETITILSEEQPPKRQKPQASNSVDEDADIAVPQQRAPRPTLHHHQKTYNPPPSPSAAFAFSPLPSTGTSTIPLEEMRANFASLAELCTQLQEENEILKKARIQEDVEDLIAQQNARVSEHSRKAKELAEHWQDEAEALALQIEELRGGSLQEEVRSLRSQLSSLQQTLIDRDVAEAERSKAVVELQKRNKFLERHARIPAISDKCVGTDPVTIVSAAMHLPQAKAMIPEGADGSSFYIGDRPEWRHHQQTKMDASYTLKHQQTVVHHHMNPPGVLHDLYASAAGGGNGNGNGTVHEMHHRSKSDMHIASSQQNTAQAAAAAANNHHMYMNTTNNRTTAESVQGNRRLSAVAPQPLIDGSGVPRQIQFYSHSQSNNTNTNNTNNNTNNNKTVNGGGALSAVPEEEDIMQHHETADGVIYGSTGNRNDMMVHGDMRYDNPLAYSDSGPPPREAALETFADMIATPLPHGIFLFTHKPTGFKCEIGRLASHDIEYDEHGSAVDTFYRPIAFGMAENVLREEMGGLFVDEFSFKSNERSRLLSSLASALARVAAL